MADQMSEKKFSANLDPMMVDESDNVAVCHHDIDQGTEAAVRLDKENFAVTATNAIPRGHKLAIREIAEGDKIIKYGEIIGQASANISKGNHVHVHNVVD